MNIEKVILNRVKSVKGVKKVFVRSGVRYDFALCEKNDKFSLDFW